MIICTICGAISTDEEMDERHFNQVHAGKDENEDAFWLQVAEMMPAEVEDLGL